MRAIVFLVLMVLVPACNAQCDVKAKERFDDFYARFAKDKAFAVSRTLYPTTTIRHEYGLEDGKSVDTKVKATVTKAMDAATPTIEQILQRNSMEFKQKLLSSHTAVIEVFKPGTDWLLSFHFVANGNCWYLDHIEDHSL